MTQPRAQSRQQAVQAETAAPLKVQLVVEEPVSTNWLLLDLPQLLPENSQVNMIQAARLLSDSTWFRNDARQYLDTIVERHRALQEESENFVQTLQQHGIPIQLDAPTVMSDEGCQRLLADMEPSATDLLIVVASSANSSFAQCLARHAPCSVLLLRKPLQSRIGRLVALLGTDGSDASAIATRKLGSLIRTTHLSVTLVTVHEPVYASNAVMAPYINIPVMEEALEQNAVITLDIAEQLLTAQDIQVLDKVSLSGSPYPELLALAQNKVRPDLIVAGSHNRSPLVNWLLGSVSQRMVQDAPYNLLIVR